jgi:nucleoside-diphosphate-sugar epimerase
MSYKIAVTGANGLVGSAVIRLALSLGHSVLALDLSPDGNLVDDSDRYQYIQCDASDFKAYKHAAEQAGCNAIIHMAALYNKHTHGELTTRLGSQVGEPIYPADDRQSQIPTRR